MNSTLIIQNKNGTKKEFRAGYAFIEAWGLIDGDRFAVIRSRNSHGPARWEKFDVRSMKLIEEYHYTKGSPVPVWVNPYLDFALP